MSSVSSIFEWLDIRHNPLLHVMFCRIWPVPLRVMKWICDAVPFIDFWVFWMKQKFFDFSTSQTNAKQIPGEDTSKRFGFAPPVWTIIRQIESRHVKRFVPSTNFVPRFHSAYNSGPARLFLRLALYIPLTIKSSLRNDRIDSESLRDHALFGSESTQSFLVSSIMCPLKKNRVELFHQFQSPTLFFFQFSNHVLISR